MSGVFQNFGPRYGDGIFGAQRFPAETVAIKLAANITANQDPANPNLLKVGTVLGLITASGNYTIVNSGATDGTQTAAGILAQNVDTSFGVQSADMYVTGDFNSLKLLFGGTDTWATHAAHLNSQNIYAEPPITTVTAGTD